MRRYDDHMRKEEELRFPLAGCDTRDFDKLFQHIAEIAPAPIGLGATAPTLH